MNRREENNFYMSNRIIIQDKVIAYNVNYEKFLLILG